MEPDTTTGAAPVDNGGNEPQIINGVAVDNQGQAIPVPEETEAPATAEEATNEEAEEQQQTTEDPGAEPTAVPETADEKLQKFASNHGLELDSPNAIKAAKMAMDNQAEFSRTRQKASELEKSMLTMSDESVEQFAEQAGMDPDVLKRVQRMEVKDSIREFFANTPDAKQYESKMTEIATTMGLSGTPEAILEASYAIAMAKDGDNLRSQGKREALQSLAHKQQAATPRGNAVNSAPVQAEVITSQNVDALVGSHDLAWFQKNREAINKAMAG
jgi:hypothetical protein